MRVAVALAMCYFIGSIPFGLIIGKIIKGIDIREYGSGNIGASNVLRILGPGPAFAALALDVAKGWGAVAICSSMGLSCWLVVCGALLSVFGHTFSVFLKFKGGKGVATSLGVIIGLDPVIAATAFVLWLMIVGVTRYISVASIIASISVPLQMVFWHSRNVPAAFQILAGIAAAAIVIKHSSNMKRLLNGNESKIGQKVVIDSEEES